MSAGTRETAVFRRYLIRTSVAMVAFAGIVVAIDKTLDPSINGWGPEAAWPLVLLTCLPLLGYAYELMHYIRSIDEMLARIQIRAGAFAALVMLLAGAIFGVAEIYGVMEPLNTAMLMPIAAVAHSVAALVQQIRTQ